MSGLIDIAYIVASVLFILGVKKLGRQETAQRGNALSALGMLIAVVATLLDAEVVSYGWIIMGIIAGGTVGWVAAQRVKMTEMPEMVALFNGSGGLASLLVGTYEYAQTPELSAFTAFAVYIAVLIGGITFTGSMVAYLKLAEKINSRAKVLKGQKNINIALLVFLAVILLCFVITPEAIPALFILSLVMILVLGVTLVLPIGGADMPVVIAMLNSFSGLAACAAGFVISNSVLIVAGSLVGASGLILTMIMCKAMNRSLANVFFSGFGSETSSSGAAGYQGEANPITAEDAYYALEAATSVVIVPGYGMAVAQAQHAVKELTDFLEENGAEVKFAIHPVAGRMPGHMNVLLAEANVPYELLLEPDDINPTIATVDVAMVIGANDVVNPAARDDEKSPLYGMPIIEVDKARTCFVLKRSLNPGFAGVDNPLFFAENTRMLFGDAKDSISTLVSEFKDS